TISIKSVNLSGNPITGMSTVIRYTNGTTISESFTPVSFTVKSGTTYVVHVRNYQTTVFNHWMDGSTNSYYTITPTQNVTLTAYYSTGTTAIVPQPPTGLTATTVSTSQINLSWTAPANNGGSVITGYKIERSTNGGTTWSTIQSNTASTATTFSDTGLTASTTYMYRVSAINPVGTSSPSNTASATTSSIKPISAVSPTYHTATTESSTHIKLTFNKPEKHTFPTRRSSDLERSTNGGTTWSTIQSNTASTATTFSDTGLTASTTYMYRVSAINPVGTSSPSNTASATTPSTTSITSIFTIATQLTT